MPVYWCRFFDERGGVVAGERLCADDDSIAIAKLKMIFAHHPATTCEMRDGKRIVTRESSEQAHHN